MTYCAWMPRSELPMFAASADLSHVRASIFHVSGDWRLVIDFVVWSNSSFSIGSTLRQRANSVQRLALRLSPEIDVAPTIGYGLVSMKFQPSQASVLVLPAPVQACSAMRGLCGNASSASACAGSGFTLKRSSTYAAGCSRQRLRLAPASRLGSPIRLGVPNA